jgi:hypothetical protein
MYHQLVEPVGKNFDPEFKPTLTPQLMLELGVFGGRYMTDCRKESSWFTKAKLSEKHDKQLPQRRLPAALGLACNGSMMIRAAGFNGLPLLHGPAFT